MFNVFREHGNPLPLINASAKESDIKKWKNSKEVKNAHKKLFKKISSSGSETFLSKIIGRVWKEKKMALKIQVIYAISICETILNPENLVIQVNEEIIKPKIDKYLVSKL